MNRHLRDALNGLSPAGYAALFWAYRFVRGENRELRTVRPLIQPGFHVADIGAHRGLHALYFRHIVGAGGIVEMFEPNPDEHERLRKLTRRYGNLELHPVGLSSTSGEATLSVPVVDGEPVASLATLERNETQRTDHAIHVPVSLTTLDEIASTLPQPLDFIKCDVEGHELHVLSGGAQTLRRDRPILLIEIEQRHCGDKIQTTLDLLHDLGYVGFFFRCGQLHDLAAFDVDRHQTRFYAAGREGAMPHAYVRDFLFLPREGRSVLDRHQRADRRVRPHLRGRGERELDTAEALRRAE